MNLFTATETRAGLCTLHTLAYTDWPFSMDITE